MKNINVLFEDDEFELLLKIKRKITWRRFILKLAGLPYDVIPYVNPQKYWKKFQKRSQP
jgi:hypothetical protein